MLDTCTAAVFGEMNSRSASWPFVSPSASRAATSRSPRRQLAVDARRRALQPAGQRLGPVLAHARPAAEVVVDRPADRHQRAGPVAGAEQRLGERRAQRADHRLGEARVGLGEHRAEGRRRRRRGRPSASASSPSAWARIAAFDGWLGQPAVEHPRRGTSAGVDPERQQVLDEHDDVVRAAIAVS